MTHLQTLVPILLTLLCLTFSANGKFPRRRVQVYEEGLDADLTNYLLDNVPASEIKRISEELRITLEPPSSEKYLKT